MKRFLAVYIGTAAAMDEWNALSEAERQLRHTAGVQAWKKWVEDNQSSIVEVGAPLGKTLCASGRGVEKIKNDLTGFTVVQAATHEQAAALFEGHPHFTLFPGHSIETMECRPIPG